jgi:acetyl esterase/lipase
MARAARTRAGHGSPRRARGSRRRSTILGALLAAAVLAGCGSSGDGAPDGSGSPAVAASAGTEAFRPDAGATVTLPTRPAAETPLVVLVPGGGWQTADPSGLIPLAEDLAARGAAVVTLTYRAAQDGAHFPVPAQDVACGLAYAVTAVDGLEVSRVVLAGHSAGAHLAALVALAPERFAAPDCPYPAVAPDAFVGLAGPYDVDELDASASDALFGSDPGTRDGANPRTYADQRPDLPVLLVHGTADDLVPTWFTEDFAGVLAARGHDVTAEYPEGATHFTVFRPEVAGPLIAAWLGLPTATPAPSGQ